MSSHLNVVLESSSRTAKLRRALVSFTILPITYRKSWRECLKVLLECEKSLLDVAGLE